MRGGESDEEQIIVTREDVESKYYCIGVKMERDEAEVNTSS